MPIKAYGGKLRHVRLCRLYIRVKQGHTAQKSTGVPTYRDTINLRGACDSMHLRERTAPHYRAYYPVYNSVFNISILVLFITNNNYLETSTYDHCTEYIEKGALINHILLFETPATKTCEL